MSGKSTKFHELSALIEEFEHNPTLQNYVTFRRRFPSGGVEIHRFAGLDSVFSMLQDIEAVDIDPAVVCGVLDGDDQAIDELSLRLMECLIERPRACSPTPAMVVTCFFSRSTARIRWFSVSAT